MKKNLIIIISLIILIFLGFFAFNAWGGITVGTSQGDGAVWPGYAQISFDHKKYDLTDDIIMNISYGHDYQYDAEYYDIISHNLVVYVVDGSKSVTNPENGIILYERSITEDELLSDEYKCDPGRWIFSKVQYNNIYEISVDFSIYDFDSGVIFIRFHETFLAQDNIDGEIEYTETTHDNAALIYFMKDEKSIQFSQRQF